MALGDPAQRAAAAQALARELGAEAVLVFVRDPVLGKLLPGLGFPQTLPGGRRWRELAEQAARDGAAQADLRVPGDGDRSGLVRAWAVDDTVLAAVKCPDPPPQERLAPALAILPLLGQVLRREMQCAGMQAQLELTQLAAGESRR